MELAARFPMIRELRGTGLMRGLDLDRPAAAVVDAARDRGLLVNGTARTVVRLLPPLTITEREIDLAVERLDAALAAVCRRCRMTDLPQPGPWRRPPRRVPPHS